MVRVGLWSDVGVDVAGALLPRIVRRELGERIPGVRVRTWRIGPGPVPDGAGAPSSEPSETLGEWSTSRADELAVAVDVLVISGRPSLAQPFSVQGVGIVNEPDLPTAWHVDGLPDEIDGALTEALREGLERRAYVSAADDRTAERLRAIVEREVVVVPGCALLADRLFTADEPERRTARLRSSGALPTADLLVVQVDATTMPVLDAVATRVADMCAGRGLVPLLVASSPTDEPALRALAERLAVAVRLPATTDVDDLCAVVGWSAGLVAASTDLTLVAQAYGRPVAPIDPHRADAGDPIALLLAEGADDGGRARADSLRARLDAHFDRIAALATGLEPVPASERKVRSLVARLAEQEAVAAARERDQAEALTQANRRLTEADIRFTALWRKIRECDKHYAFHFERAEKAEALVASLRADVARLRRHQRFRNRVRATYPRVRRFGGNVLRRLHLRPPLPPPDA